jgi:hypothetical protein
MTAFRYAIAIVLVAGAAGLGVRLYVLYRRAERARAILEELIAANRARPRPGMERRDDRLLDQYGRRRPTR